MKSFLKLTARPHNMEGEFGGGARGGGYLVKKELIFFDADHGQYGPDP